MHAAVFVASQPTCAPMEYTLQLAKTSNFSRNTYIPPSSTSPCVLLAPLCHLCLAQQPHAHMLSLSLSSHRP